MNKYLFLLFSILVQCNVHCMELLDNFGKKSEVEERAVAKEMPLPTLFDLSVRKIPDLIAKKCDTTPGAIDWNRKSVQQCLKSELSILPSDCIPKIMVSLTKPISWQKSTLGLDKIVHRSNDNEHFRSYQESVTYTRCQGQLIVDRFSYKPYKLFARSKDENDGFVVRYIEQFDSQNNSAIIKFNGAHDCKYYRYVFQKNGDARMAHLPNRISSTYFLEAYSQLTHTMFYLDEQHSMCIRNTGNSNWHIKGLGSTCMKINDAQNLLAIGTDCCGIQLWCIDSCKRYYEDRELSYNCSDVAFNSDGTLLFSGGLAGKIFVFDVDKKCHAMVIDSNGVAQTEEYDPLAYQNPTGCLGPIHAMNCSSDGATLAVATERYDRALWSLPALGLAKLLGGIMEKEKKSTSE